MNVTASGSLVFCTSQHNHAQPTLQKHKSKEQFKKVKINNMEVFKVMAHSFKEEEYDGKI